MRTDLAPIVLFVYNRPWHTRRCLESLTKNHLADESVLFIYADGPKENATEEQLQKISEVRKLIREKKWCGDVHIIEQEKNKGLADSVIDGVTEIVNRYGKIIVLEDDLVLSKGFLEYMNDALSLYEKQEKVMHISGYMFPVKNAEKLPETFFFIATSCWGWGTWQRAWKILETDSKLLLKKIETNKHRFNLEGAYPYYEMLQSVAECQLDSWAIKWYASVFVNEGLCLHPNVSLVRNIGHDDEGVHCKKSWWSKIYTRQEIAESIKVEPIELVQNKEAKEVVKEFYISLGKPPLWVRAMEKMKLGLKN